MTMPVRVIWYSDEPGIDRYHICRSCWQYRKIHRSNLRVTTMDRRPDGLRLCRDCRWLKNLRICGRITLKVARG